MLIELKRYEEAIISCERAIKIKPSYEDAWFKKGDALFRLNRFKEAIASLDTVIQINPKAEDAIMLRQVAQSRLKFNPPVTIIIEREYTSPNIGSRTGKPLDPSTGKPFQFRVVVLLTSNLESYQVRAVVPDAFRLSRGDKMYMQLQAFSEQKDADAYIRVLSRLGLSAIVIPF